MSGRLLDADRLRATDPAQALRLYAETHDRIESDCADRILWICDQVAPTPPPEIEPFLERVAAGEPGLLRRAALHGLATVAYYSGRRARAEELWAQGLREPTTTRDRFWIRSCLNLAHVLHERRCLYEPLVLTGMGQRAAASAGNSYLLAYAALRRAELLLHVGETRRAEESVGGAEWALERVAGTGRRRVIQHELLDIGAKLALAHGDLGAALDARRRQIEWLEEYLHVEDPVLAAAHAALAKLRFRAEPANRGAILAEFASIPDRFDLGEAWRDGWERDLAQLCLRQSLALGDKEAAREAAAALLDHLRGHATGPELAEVGRLLADELDSADLAREAFEAASARVLARIVEAHRKVEEIPELAEATEDDRAVLRAYRERLAADQRKLLELVAARLEPGEPVFDLLAKDDLICLCAWCGRVRTRDGRWLPVAHFLPPDPSPKVTHGICDDCRNRHFG